MDPAARKVLIEEVQVIINSAASINFDDPIRDALQINFFGASRVLELAHECKNLLAMHHVSTSYVSSYMPTNSTAMEEVVPITGDPNFNADEVVAGLMNMEPQMLEREEPNILKRFNFANTYTFTKNLAEQALKANRRPDLRLSISRPAIITACDKYPFPGWTDTIAAGGAVLYSLGRGFAQRVYHYPSVVAAFVPCDYAVNTILVQTTLSAAQPKPGFHVVHASPSGCHPNYKQS